ncbi:winged helix-turn-helix domain-containing protein [Altererythrobacter sp. ZODW24]|uniref:winged helix-turn-helix domain-containing protein n=1 Tax=Altererythrobacter sp. ZODW24 TaxID=2185142 RepID=UPI001F0864CD|nr:winged helix-turn-helix domain-containing protein [Altererythrobacter sp. ZODW24]
MPDIEPSYRPKMMPRELAAGPVMLDFFHHDGRVGERWIGLHPREFKLLWRLAEVPSCTVTKEQLLRDVWRLRHYPETNSIEVHVSRLRAKLAVFSCDWLVVTDPEGGYRLTLTEAEGALMAGSARRPELDGYTRTDDDKNTGEN